MKTLFIECNMGAAGDMLMGALIGVAPRKALERLGSLGIPGVEIWAEHGKKHSIRGIKVHVEVNGEEEKVEDVHSHEQAAEPAAAETAAGHDHEHEQDQDHDHGEGHDHKHYSVEDIGRVIIKLPVPGKVKKDAFAVYMQIAAAEAKVHGTTIEQVHFHELGSMDAVADVVGCCLLMDAIAADRVVVSPINVGSGSVKCAHGVLPVPAPATTEILMNKEYYTDGTEGELCTPTGAALLAYYADEFGGRPAMKTTAVGIGLGEKDYPKANMLRVFLGEAAEHEDAPAVLPGDGITEPLPAPEGKDRVTELSANIDDMTGEELGYAMDAILAAGALDVWYTPIVMKKSRPAVKLSCLVVPEQADALAEVIIRQTETAGVRRADYDRYVLDREIEESEGLRIKRYTGYGVNRTKAEYDDLAEIAKSKGISLREAARLVENKE